MKAGDQVEIVDRSDGPNQRGRIIEGGNLGRNHLAYLVDVGSDIVPPRWYSAEWLKAVRA